MADPAAADAAVGHGPSIEVVIPFHRNAAYLREAVASLRAQTTPHWRGLVIDDAGPDPDAAAWVADLGDDRIRLVRNQHNRGIVGTFNQAATLATADHVTVMGADDRLLPTYVETTRALLRRTPVEVVQPGVRVIDEDGRVTRPRADRVKQRLRPAADPDTTLAGEDLLCSLLRGNWTYFPSLCWRRSVIAGLGFRAYPVVLDLALLVDVVLAGGRLTVADEVTFEYRRHRSSLSSLSASDGSRFAEERAFHDTTSTRLRLDGHRRAARAARLRLTSRAHAASLVPGAVARGDLGAVGALTRHAVAG